jgi:protocatechuate 3,4-dioxygenase beta subunit
MKRFVAATHGWRVSAVAGVLLAAVALAGPTAAASLNQNLTATAKYSASSYWDSDSGSTTFIADRAFDGDLSTRWNGYTGTGVGEWLAAQWNSPVTMNHVVVREYADRIDGLRVQRFDTPTNAWVDVAVVEADGFKAKKIPNGGNPIISARFDPVQTTGMRMLITSVTYTDSQSIRELEAWNNPAGTLTGTVTDPSGKPVAGVAVRAGDDQTLTDAGGKYTLVTDAGSDTVVASLPASFHDRTTRGIAVAANSTVTHDIMLAPLPANLSLTATAVASTEYAGGGFEAGKANDGDLTTRWNSDSGDTAGAYLEMQWPQAQTFNKVAILEDHDRIRNYSLQSYDEASAKYVDIPGASNINVPSPQSSDNPTLTHIFATPVTSKRLRLLVNAADDTPSVWELEVQNVPVATLTGVVKDVAGNPVPNATVVTDQGVVLGTTDAKGAFSALAEPDEYSVTASAAGYFTSAPVLVELNPNGTQTITLITPAQGPDIALTAKASASSEDPAWPATNVNDGDLTTYWLATGDTSQWVALTWPKPTHFTAVQLRGFRNNIERSVLQILASDGTTWMDVPNTVFVPFGTPQPDFLFPDGMMTTGLRLSMSATDTAGTPPGVSEFLVFDTPLPKPAP